HEWAGGAAPGPDDGATAIWNAARVRAAADGRARERDVDQVIPATVRRDVGQRVGPVAVVRHAEHRARIGAGPDAGGDDVSTGSRDQVAEAVAELDGDGRGVPHRAAGDTRGGLTG